MGATTVYAEAGRSGVSVSGARFGLATLPVWAFTQSIIWQA